MHHQMTSCTLMTLLVFKQDFSAKDPPLDSDTDCFGTLNQKLALGPALPPLIEIEDWDKQGDDCCQA